MRYKLAIGLIMGMMIIIGFAIIGLVTATETNIGIRKQGDCINLVQTCSNCSYNTLTSIVHPNGYIETLNINMSKDGTHYNQTYCNSSSYGGYIVNGFGDLDGDDTVWSYGFTVTQDGKEKERNITNSIAIIIMLLVITYFFIYKYDKFVGSFFIILIGVGTMAVYPANSEFTLAGFFIIFIGIFSGISNWAMKLKSRQGGLI